MKTRVTKMSPKVLTVKKSKGWDGKTDEIGLSSDLGQVKVLLMKQLIGSNIKG